MKKAWIIGLILIGTFSSCIDEPVPFENTYQGNFDALWTIIDTRYCYLDYKNINWDSIRTEYNARLNTVGNNIELFDLMAEMLAELKDGHVNLTSSFDRSRYWNWYTDSASHYNSSLITSERYLSNDYRIAGGFRYKAIHGGRIGYMYYGDFSSAFSAGNVNNIFKLFSACEGLIIDVRNNGGGSLGYSEQLASYFFTEERTTGYLRHKKGDGHSDFSDYVSIKTPSGSPQWDDRPVVILTNRMSYSATNDFVNRMKQCSNATIVGRKTGGGGGLPLSSELPNGWTIRFSASPMYDSNKQHTEWGIEPDYYADIEALGDGYDGIIEKAIDLIMQQWQ